MKSRELFLLFFIIIFMAGCNNKNKDTKVVEEKFAFGTYFQIVIFDKNKKIGEQHINKAFDEIDRIDKTYNSRVLGSKIDQLNNTGKQKFSAEGIYLFNKTKEIYELSNKKYDITMEPLMKIWGFYDNKFTKKSVPTSSELKEAAKKVDYSAVKILGDNVFIKTKGVRIDTGSFLKGYAIKKATENLREVGVKSAFLSAISSIQTIGLKPDGTPWRIGVQDPDNPLKILGILELNNQSVGVSGDYQTFVEIDGKKYHHILDKDTQFPVKDKRMVVVVTNDAFEADMYSTAFFLMPIKKVINYVNNTKKLDVLIMDKNKKIYVSQNINFIKSEETKRKK